MSSWVYKGYITHFRKHPKKNFFKYPMFFFAIDLSKLDELQKLWTFNINKFGMYSLYDKDHLKFLPENQTNIPIYKKIKNYIETKHSISNISKIILATNVRIAGYVFNPVSFYYIYRIIDEKEILSSVLCEVNNTFGEQKEYFIFDYKNPPTLKKFFYISPFISPEGEFEFIFKEPEEKLFVQIDAKEDENLVLRAILTGSRMKISNRTLLGFLFKLPFYTLQIIIFIHYQALKLFFKKVPFFTKNESDLIIQKNISFGDKSK